MLTRTNSLRGAVVAVLCVVAAIVSGSASSADSGPTTGVVVVQTRLGYASGVAAGTGIVISRAGVVLTNNHVIRGATAVRVTDPRTGRRYASTVLGYSISGDIAVLRLQGVSELATASVGRSVGLRVGQSVTAVGNAGGTGRLAVSSGRIQALGRSITVDDDQGGSARLRGLIRTSASLQPGDSGGPLLDASGRVIGIDTAASSRFAFRSAGGEGYAIPIDRAMSVARQILAGRSSAVVHVGPTAFLGILTAPPGTSDASGALVAEVVPGGPADRVGIERGDLITTVGGRRVTAVSGIVAAIQRRKPGDRVRFGWLDGVGNRMTGLVRLAAGPPQ